MLVLSRQLGQSVIIAGTIRVTVVEILPGRARLHVEAPRGIPIFRAELPPEAQDELRARCEGLPTQTLGTAHKLSNGHAGPRFASLAREETGESREERRGEGGK